MTAHRAQSQMLHGLVRGLPVVAILGRPNVGKSTLFNRLTGVRQAITDDAPGVTRDRVLSEVEWNGIHFALVDTGGYVPDSADAMEVAVRHQAESALEEADVVLLVCDGSSGVTQLDRDVADLLRRRSTCCVLAVNKLDHPEQLRYEGEFYALGLGEPLPVSAATGRQSGDLLDALVERLAGLDLPSPEGDEDQSVRVVIAGRPNVGKSTLINRLAGHEVSIVADEPGTTRDPTAIRIAWGGQDFVLMDTAGLRRRSRIDGQVEYYSTLRASSSIQEADVVIVLVDGGEGLASQDARIMSQVIEAGRGLVVAVNKWDLVERGNPGAEDFRQNLRERLPFLRDYPIVFVSALTGRRVDRCLESAGQARLSCHTRVPTAALNRCVEDVSRQLSPSAGGREIRLLYATQHSVAPPTFVIFCNRPDLVGDSYRRYLENNLRREFGFVGAPLRITWRGRRRGGGRAAGRVRRTGG